MTTKQFVEKVIEGGRYDLAISVKINRGSKIASIKYRDSDWDGTSTWSRQYSIHEILLDPLAWEAVGKVEGWGDVEGKFDEQQNKDVVQTRMLNMVITLCQGKSIEEYLETL